jgi:hypothetical protein
VQVRRGEDLHERHCLATSSGSCSLNATPSHLVPRGLRGKRSRRRRCTYLSRRPWQDSGRSSASKNGSMASSRSSDLWRCGQVQARIVQSPSSSTVVGLRLHRGDLWSGAGLPHNRDARREEGCPRLVQRDQRQVIRRRASQCTVLTTSLRAIPERPARARFSPWAERMPGRACHFDRTT